MQSSHPNPPQLQPPRSSRVHVHQDRSPPKPVPKQQHSRKGNSFSDKLRHVFSDVHTNIQRPGEVSDPAEHPPEHNLDQKQHSSPHKPVNLHKQDSNSKLESSRRYTPQSLNASARLQPSRKPLAQNKSDVLKPQRSPKVSKNTPKQGSTVLQQLSDTTSATRAQNSSRPKQDRSSRGRSRERSARPPFTLIKREPVSGQVSPHPSKASEDVRSPPKRLLASDVQFNQHPLSLVFSSHVHIYKQHYLSSIPKNLAVVRDGLLHQQDDGIAREEQLIEIFNARVAGSFAPLSEALGSDGEHTVGDELEAWRHGARKAWTDFKTLSGEYDEALKAIGAFKEDMQVRDPHDPKGGTYAYDVAEVNQKFEIEKQKYVEDAKKSIEHLIEQLHKSERGTIEKTKKVRDKMQEYLDAMKNDVDSQEE